MVTLQKSDKPALLIIGGGSRGWRKRVAIARGAKERRIAAAREDRAKEGDLHPESTRTATLRQSSISLGRPVPTSHLRARILSSRAFLRCAAAVGGGGSGEHKETFLFFHRFLKDYELVASASDAQMTSQE